MTPLEQAKESIIAATIGSCECITKSPDAAYHAAHCRYLKLLQALDSLDDVSMSVAEIDAVAGKWIMEAQKHEMAAREIDDDQDEEVTLHREIAATLYQCAQDLQHPERPSAPEEEPKF